MARNSGLQVQVRELDVAPLQIQGPKSRDLVAALFGSLELKYYQFVEKRIDNIPVIVTRTGWTGELGYELYLLDPKRGVDLWNRVMEAGKPFGIAPTGPSDIRRIEAGILNYGIDMTLENNPYEVGLERLVSLEKEFIGKEALEKIAKDGPKKKLIGIEIEGSRIEMNFTRWPVKGGGFVTSAIWSPRLKKNIGYAMMDNKKIDALEVETPAGVRKAKVVPMPFIDPTKSIAKS